MTAMLSAPEVLAEFEDPRPDWVVALRLLDRRDPGCKPTEAEIRLVVWFLLDQGSTVVEICHRTGLSKKDVTRTYDLRCLAAEPDRPRGRNGGLNPAAARALAPDWYNVMLLGGAYAHSRQIPHRARAARP